MLCAILESIQKKRKKSQVRVDSEFDFLTDNSTTVGEITRKQQWGSSSREKDYHQKMNKQTYIGKALTVQCGISTNLRIV